MSVTSAAVRSLSVTEPVTGFTLHTPGDSEHRAEAAAAWTLFQLSIRLFLGSPDWCCDLLHR